jgi:DNA (cytosine-5)-methyltransferase 1
MKHLDLFAGIGGFSLAARWAGIETVAFCEIDENCHKVLNKHWPELPIHKDIKTLNGGDYEGIDIITGGYPCQPFSTAGHQKGEKDPRHLWPQMLRVIKQSRPTWVITENVAGHVSMGLDKVIHDLETQGYAARALVIPACSVGARHKRNRVWIIAYSKSDRRDKGWENKGWGVAGVRKGEEQGSRDVFSGLWGMPLESSFSGGAYGLSGRVDRLTGLGNAIVPQIAYEILKAIKAF